jgi:parallel beta-helix repeat protein
VKASKAFLFVFLIVFSLCLVTTQHTQSQSPGTIYIRSDGSVDPDTAPIQIDGNIYTFTDNINIDSGDCGIEVDRDNIVIDGAGFALQGTAAYISRGIDLSGRSNVTIKNMEIRNFMDGIYLVASSNNTITGNYITANTDSGIWTSGVSNTITGNYIANNEIGILFEVSHDLVYHNNFVNNTKQVADICWTNPWLPSSATILDDGYPSGGNYWSDYNGTDLYSSPHQNITGSDGIGDHPYIIDENNQDNCPLMGMFYDFTVEIELGQIYHLRVISNSTVSNLEVRVWLTSANEYLQPGDEFIYYVVDGEEGSVGFCRIMIPRVVLNDSYVVLVDWHEVSATELPFSNSTHAYLYFTYNHSTNEVVIVPEFPSWTPILLLLIVLTVAVAIYKRRLLQKR